MKVPERPLNAAAFEELAMPLFDQLYNFARWLAHDASEAEDLVQETYVKALRGFSSFEAGTNFRAWMFRILRNAFLTSRTGLKEKTTLEDEDADAIASTEPTPEALILAEADRDTVRMALAALPVSQREILLLCEVEEMSYQEIALTLGIPAGTVMSRLHRARKALRRQLTTVSDGGPRGL